MLSSARHAVQRVSPCLSSVCYRGGQRHVADVIATVDACTEQENYTDVFLKEALEKLQLQPSWLEKLLISSNRELAIQLTVAMDDGAVQDFKAFRVHHNNARGPYKGGIIYHPTVNQEVIRSLASLNTWKTALLGVPFGGSKGGVAVDPRRLSERELERLTRKFVQATKEWLGPFQDVPAPDIGTDERHMAWIFDEYSKFKGFSPAVVTGKPAWLHGSLVRDSAPGHGVVLATREFLRHTLKTHIDDHTYIVQGYGKIGSRSAALLHRAGGKVIAVSDIDSAVYNPEGLAIPALHEHVYRNGNLLKTFPGGQAVSRESAAFLSIPCDVVVLAGLGGMVNSATAPLLRCAAVVEGANSAITPAGDQVLQKRGLPVLPDLYANGGGVVVSHFEWVQNVQNFKWEEDEILRQLDRHMSDAFHSMWSVSKASGVPLRSAAYTVAVERVARAERDRGFD